MNGLEIVLRVDLNKVNRLYFLEKQFNILIRSNAIAMEYSYYADNVDFTFYYGRGMRIHKKIISIIMKYNLKFLVYFLGYLASYSSDLRNPMRYRRSAEDLFKWIEEFGITRKTGLKFVCCWNIGGLCLPDWPEDYTRIPF